MNASWINASSEEMKFKNIFHLNKMFSKKWSNNALLCMLTLLILMPSYTLFYNIYILIHLMKNEYKLGKSLSKWLSRTKKKVIHQETTKQSQRRQRHLKWNKTPEPSETGECDIKQFLAKNKKVIIFGVFWWRPPYDPQHDLKWETRTTVDEVTLVFNTRRQPADAQLPLNRPLRGNTKKRRPMPTDSPSSPTVAPQNEDGVAPLTHT